MGADLAGPTKNGGGIWQNDESGRTGKTGSARRPKALEKNCPHRPDMVYYL